MSDLGDLIGQAPLGEQPATITVDVYAWALAEINTARAEIERLRERPDARQALRAVLAAVQIRHEFIERDVRQIATDMGVQL